MPVAIAVPDAVGDASTAILAVHFYGGIGTAQTIGSAMDSGWAMFAIAQPDAPDPLALRAAGNVDPYVVRLIITS